MAEHPFPIIEKIVNDASLYSKFIKAGFTAYSLIISICGENAIFQSPQLKSFISHANASRSFLKLINIVPATQALVMHELVPRQANIESVCSCVIRWSDFGAACTEIIGFIQKNKLLSEKFPITERNVERLGTMLTIISLICSLIIQINSKKRCGECLESEKGDVRLPQQVLYYLFELSTNKAIADLVEQNSILLKDNSPSFLKPVSGLLSSILGITKKINPDLIEVNPFIKFKRN